MSEATHFFPKPGLKVPVFGNAAADVPENGVRISPASEGYYRRCAARGEGTIGPKPAAAKAAKQPAAKPAPKKEEV